MNAHARNYIQELRTTPETQAFRTLVDGNCYCAVGILYLSENTPMLCSDFGEFFDITDEVNTRISKKLGIDTVWGHPNGEGYRLGLDSIDRLNDEIHMTFKEIADHLELFEAYYFED